MNQSSEYNLQDVLRQLPSVDRLILMVKADAALAEAPQRVIRQAARQVLEDLRHQLRQESPRPTDALSEHEIVAAVCRATIDALSPNLQRVVNATGVVVHTNLGRSLLADAALERIQAVSQRYSNLEFDLAQGQRGSRYTAVEQLICDITGAPAAMVVNNNAGAVLLCLDTLARGQQVVVSRGELVEIGGAFRIPDVMAKSNAHLVEVGTTNRTHARDYIQAITPETALLLKVHQSNFSIVGFTKAVSLREMVTIGQTHNIAVMEDLGSGTFVDFADYGMLHEPTVQESVAAGVDLITFSGDKLLGGPQAGIIVGRTDLLERIRANPLTRALRIDKMTLAALEGTLRLYLDPQTAVAAIPTLAMLTEPLALIQQRAATLKAELAGLNHERLEIFERDSDSKVGGGALPLLQLPTHCIGVRVAGRSVNQLERYLRTCACPPIVARIEADGLLFDPRTVRPDEINLITQAVSQYLTDI